MKDMKIKYLGSQLIYDQLTGIKIKSVDSTCAIGSKQISLEPTICADHELLVHQESQIFMG